MARTRRTARKSTGCQPTGQLAPRDVPPQQEPQHDSDRAGMPDLSVRWIISIGGGGDSRDPTTNETGRGALAITEPTPNGY
jgi:hypothetical protein